LWIVGSNPAPPVKNLASEIIDVTGYVTEYELVSKYAEARVAVVPLRFGAGVKLKVVEALWEGLPLVTTSSGAQGLEGLGEVATVVDEAEPLARELVRLLRDDVSWVEQAQRQLDYAQVHFSRQVSIEALREATSAVAANAERRRRGATCQPV
jgi:glycosyltransferase involved in cell wall biosynthesis